MLFNSTLMPLNHLVYVPNIYALTEVQRQSYSLLYIFLYLLRPAWPNNGLIRSTNYYGSGTIISTVTALRILRLKVSSVNNSFSALPLNWSFSRHFRPKIFISKTYSLIK
jgi:hypothetical protein